MKLSPNFGPKKFTRMFYSMIILILMLMFCAKVGKCTKSPKNTVPDISKIQDDDTTVIDQPIKRKRQQEPSKDYDGDIEDDSKKIFLLQKKFGADYNQVNDKLGDQKVVQENPSEILKNKALMLAQGKQYISIVKIILQLHFKTKTKNLQDKICAFLFKTFDFFGIPDSETLQRDIPKNVNAVYIKVAPEFNQTYYDKKNDSYDFNPDIGLFQHLQYLFLDLSDTNIMKTLKILGNKNYYVILPSTVSNFHVNNTNIKYLELQKSQNDTLKRNKFYTFDIKFSDILNFDLNPDDHRLPKFINIALFEDVEIKALQFQYDTIISHLKINFSLAYDVSDSIINWEKINLPSKVKNLTIDVKNTQDSIISLLAGISEMQNLKNVEVLNLIVDLYDEFQPEEFKKNIQTIDLSKFTNLQQLYIDSNIIIESFQWPKMVSDSFEPLILDFKNLSDLTLTADLFPKKIHQLSFCDVKITSMNFQPGTLISDLIFLFSRQYNPGNSNQIFLPDTVESLSFVLSKNSDFKCQQRIFAWIAALINVKSVKKLKFELPYNYFSKYKNLKIDLSKFKNLQQLNILSLKRFNIYDKYIIILPDQEIITEIAKDSLANKYNKLTSTFDRIHSRLYLILLQLFSTEIFENFRFNYLLNTKYVEIKVFEETAELDSWIHMVKKIITQNSFHLEELIIQFYGSDSWFDPNFSYFFNLWTVSKVTINFYDPQTKENYHQAEQFPAKI